MPMHSRRIAWFVSLGVAMLGANVCAYGQIRKEIYDLQERCGKSATELFDRDYPKDQRNGLTNFENHHNVRLNKCFMLEDSTTVTHDQGKAFTYRFLALIDVQDNKVYASFDSLACEVQGKKCGTEEEFRTLIRPLMEE
jgi:hypothetical protein